MNFIWFKFISNIIHHRRNLLFCIDEKCNESTSNYYLFYINLLILNYRNNIFRLYQLVMTFFCPVPIPIIVRCYIEFCILVYYYIVYLMITSKKFKICCTTYLQSILRSYIDFVFLMTTYLFKTYLFIL